MFWKKKEIRKKSYDRENQKPVLKCSICNGEQVAGFQDLHTGKIEEVMFIRNEQDLKEFMEMYDLEGTITKVY